MLLGFCDGLERVCHGRERGRTGYRWLSAVRYQLFERLPCARRIDRARWQCFAKSLKPLGGLPVPFFDGGLCPFGSFAGVAIVTCVRCSELNRKVGPRDPHAVIPPDIDYHVGPRRHMTFDALGPARPGSMKVMRRRIVLRGMALQAKVGACGSKLEAVRVMAVTAGHTVLEHPALDERAVPVTLVPHLPVGKVDVFVPPRQHT